MKSQPALARIPETMGPEEIGPHLRSLREQFKLTPQDVSERLHIRVRYVNAIEEAKYENMPGKVYARGYVHTYAEFLGLDAEQVVAQCFPPVSATVAVAAEQENAPAAKAVAPTPQVIKPFASPTLQKQRSSKRSIVVAGSVVVALMFGYSLFSGGSSTEKQEEPTVAPVPEEMLASVRNEIMPTSQNYVCLTTSNILSCFLAQNTVQQLQQLEQEAIHPYAEDLAGVVVAEKEPEAAKEPEEKAPDAAVEVTPAEVKPADIKPATEAETHEPQ